MEDCGGKRAGGQWDEGGGGASTKRWRTAEGRGRAVSRMRGRRGVHEEMKDCGGKRAGGQRDEGEEEGRPRGDGGLRREEGGRSAG